MGTRFNFILQIMFVNKKRAETLLNLPLVELLIRN